MSSVPDDFDMKKMSDRNYKGEDFNINPDLLKEPFERRKCTDCFCGLIFLVFLSGILGMCIYGYNNGNVGELLAPIASDPMDAICGYTDGTSDMRYLYIWNLNQALVPPYSIFGYTTCVSECPQIDTDFTQIKCADYNNTCGSAAGQQYRYSTSAFLYYCVPVASSVTTDTIPNAA